MYRAEPSPSEKSARKMSCRWLGKILLLGSLALAMLSSCAGCTQALSPMIVANLAAIAVSSTEAQLNWIDADGEDGYRIERTINDGVFVAIAETPAGTTSYTDNDLARGLTYCYRVQAYNSEGVSP